MPQLPSGRHVALDPVPLAELASQAEKGVFVHKLMAIRSAEDAFSYIGVNYFRPKGSRELEVKLADQSAIPPADLEQYPSGFNLVTIQDELPSWSTDDRAAFLQFLRETRTHNYLEGLLRAVREVQDHILGNPSTLPGLLATWWMLGVHPLQEDDRSLSQRGRH